MISTSILRCGEVRELPKPVSVQAGPLSAVFEPHTGFLRYVRLGDHEVVRAIYGAVRDQHWATVPTKISNLKTEVQQDRFTISFDALCRHGDVDFQWHGVIKGEASGEITYSFDGEARSVFLRNRIGLCVLHPIVECAGKACTIKHPDGSETKSGFPRMISPDQPFFNVEAITHEIANTGVLAELQFAGDVFETEDQRNWTDASFKTYSTPLSLPAPVKVQPGTKISQTVTLSLKQHRPVLPILQGRAPQFSIATTPVLTLPPIGLCLPKEAPPLTSREVDRLKALRLSHLRVDVDLQSPEVGAVLEGAWNDANRIGAGLHVAVTLSDKGGGQLKALASHLDRINPKVILWLLYDAARSTVEASLVRDAQSLLSRYSPLFAAGTREFFADINRSRPAADYPAFLCCSVNPQVHQPDLLTLIENIAAQAATAETAREFFAKPVVLSPISLKSPCNPEATLKRTPPALPPDVDLRQMSLLGAGWTLGSIARLAATGNVQGLTYFETVGWRGVMESETGPPLPELFPARPGSVFPIYHVLADIGEFPGRQVYPTLSSHPLLTEGLTLSDGRSRRRILVASFSPEPLDVKIKTGSCKAMIRYLDETNAEEAIVNPEAFRSSAGQWVEAAAGKIELHLLPFALARVDIS